MKKGIKGTGGRSRLFGAEEVNEIDGAASGAMTSVADETVAEAFARKRGNSSHGSNYAEEHPPTVMRGHDIEESAGVEPAARIRAHPEKNGVAATRRSRKNQKAHAQETSRAEEQQGTRLRVDEVDESTPGAHRVDGPNSYIETEQFPATRPPPRQVSITDQPASTRTFVAQAELVLDSGEDPGKIAEMKGLRKDVQSLKDENKAMRRKVCVAIAIGATLVVIGAALGSYFGLRSIGGDDDGTAPPNPTPSPMFTTPFPTNEFGLTLSSLIEDQIPTVSLDDPNDPASRALYWMTHEDEAYSSGLSEQRLLQRFALTTLWYSTGGESTWNRDEGGWVEPGTHECWWDDSNDRRQDVTCGDNDEVKRLLMCCSGLKGRIPGEEMSLLSKLSRLDLHSNELTGTIPSLMGAFTDMFWMDLYNNTLEGTIPTEIGNLEDMTWWSVADNSGIDGKVPTELGQLTKLSIFFLQGTDLSGSIPNNLCPNLERADIECDKIECDCCQDHSGTQCNQP